jgi:uncharacterized membrane protein
LLVGIAALAVVGVVAYSLGLGADHGTVRSMFGPMRGYHGGYGFSFDFGPFGLLGAVLLGVLLVWLFVALISALVGGAQRAPTDPASVDRLRELAEMHAKGALTDDEFTAAKRKLLGL